MTVRELIERLKTEDPDALVRVKAPSYSDDDWSWRTPVLIETWEGVNHVLVDIYGE